MSSIVYTVYKERLNSHEVNSRYLVNLTKDKILILCFCKNWACSTFLLRRHTPRLDPFKWTGSCFLVGLKSAWTRPTTLADFSIVMRYGVCVVWSDRNTTFTVTRFIDREQVKCTEAWFHTAVMLHMWCQWRQMNSGGAAGCNVLQFDVYHWICGDCVVQNGCNMAGRRLRW